MRPSLTSSAVVAVLCGALQSPAQNPPAQTPAAELEAAQQRAEEAQREVDAINREARAVGEGSNIPQAIQNVSTRLSESEEQARRMRESIERLGGTAEELDKVRKEMDEAWIIKKTDPAEESIKYVGEGIVGWLVLSEIGKKATGIIGIVINVAELGARKYIKYVNVSEMEKLVEQQTITMGEVYKLSVAVHRQADADRATLGTLKGLQTQARAASGRLAEANQNVRLAEERVRLAEERAQLLEGPARANAIVKPRETDPAGDYQEQLKGGVRSATPRRMTPSSRPISVLLPPGTVNDPASMQTLLSEIFEWDCSVEKAKLAVSCAGSDGVATGSIAGNRVRVKNQSGRRATPGRVDFVQVLDAVDEQIARDRHFAELAAARQAAADTATQRVGTAEDSEDILEEIESMTVIAQDSRPGLPLLVERGWNTFSAARVNGLSANVRRSTSVGASSIQAQAADARSAVQILFTSLGVSTGEAFEVQVVNNDRRPAVFDNLSFMLEPLAKDAASKIQQEMLKLGAGRIRKLKLNAYCLEHLRLPPTAGQVFRLAPPDAQARLAPTRKIFQASRQLLREGALKPDSEPKAYFHSIRQWAIWTAEQGFDQKRFENAFVEHTRKNLEAGGRKWSPEFDKALRGAVPHRWQQVNLVLQAARVAQSGDR